MSVIASLAGGALRASRLGAREGGKKRNPNLFLSLRRSVRSLSPPTGFSQKPNGAGLKHTSQATTHTQEGRASGWTAVKLTNNTTHATPVYTLQVINPKSPKY